MTLLCNFCTILHVDGDIAGKSIYSDTHSIKSPEPGRCVHRAHRCHICKIKKILKSWIFFFYETECSLRCVQWWLEMIQFAPCLLADLSSISDCVSLLSFDSISSLVLAIISGPVSFNFALFLLVISLLIATSFELPKSVDSYLQLISNWHVLSEPIRFNWFQSNCTVFLKCLISIRLLKRRREGEENIWLFWVFIRTSIDTAECWINLR